MLAPLHGGECDNVVSYGVWTSTPAVEAPSFIWLFFFILSKRQMKNELRGTCTMGMLRMVEKGGNYAQHLDLPAFYMNDFSVIGLVVGGLQQATDVLAKNGIAVEQSDAATVVTFHDEEEMHAILSALSTEQVDYSLSDLVSCAYQG